MISICKMSLNITFFYITAKSPRGQRVNEVESGHGELERSISLES